MSTHRVAAGCLAIGIVFSCAFGQTRAPESVKQTRAKTKAPEKQKAPPPQDLTRAETIPFGCPAAVGASARNYCDAEGNVYLQYTTAKPRIGPGQVIVPVSPQDQPVTKLSLDSQSTEEFAVHSLDGYRSLTPVLFSVGRDGDVYRLYQAQPTSLPYRGFLSLRYVVVKFNEDGSVDSAVRLQNPPYSMLDVTSFVAFADGNLLVTGVLGPAPASQSDEAGTPYTPRFRIVHHTPSGYGSFTGIFDSSGHFVQQLSLRGDTSPNPQTTARAGELPKSARREGPAPRKGTNTASQARQRKTPKPTSWVAAVGGSIVAPGPEDTVYLLRASNPPILYTLSSNGRVIHEAGIQDYLAPEAQPLNISAAGRANVMINFHTATVDKKGKVHYGSVFAVIDPENGRPIAAYRLPKNSNVLPACAAGPNDFEFIGSTKHGRMEVVKFTGD